MKYDCNLYTFVCIICLSVFSNNDVTAIEMLVSSCMIVFSIFFLG